MYRVIEAFFDLKDGNYHYEAGAEYPRPDYEPSQERIAELAGRSNRMGCALIEAVERPVEPPEEEPKEIPATDGETPERPVSERQRGRKKKVEE